MRTMWQKLQQRFAKAPRDSEPSEQQVLEYAAASLLIEMGHSDMQFDPLERDAIRKSLTEVFSLSQADVCALLDRAEQGHNQSVTFHPHVETINAECSQEQKAQIIEQIWRVAMADGRLDKYEEHYLRKLADLLHVPHRVLLQAKHRVLNA